MVNVVVQLLMTTHIPPNVCLHTPATRHETTFQLNVDLLLFFHMLRVRSVFYMMLKSIYDFFTQTTISEFPPSKTLINHSHIISITLPLPKTVISGKF